MPPWGLARTLEASSLLDQELLPCEHKARPEQETAGEQKRNDDGADLEEELHGNLSIMKKRLSTSWLRVFRSPDVTHLGPSVGQARQARALQSENCVARGDSEYDKMGMITAHFTRVLQRCVGYLGMHFLLIFQ